MTNPKRTIRNPGQTDLSGEATTEMMLNEEEFNMDTTSLLLPEEPAGVQQVVSFTFSEPGLVLLLD